jgi:DUF4097 and DUF4098 domain-containing protein YvlB
MKTDEEMLLDLFEVVENYVISDCDDGWGFVVSKNYKELADKFEAYDKTQKGYFSFREDFEEQNFIMFHEDKYDQEGITFTNKIPDNYEYIDEPILVVIR